MQMEDLENAYDNRTTRVHVNVQIYASLSLARSVFFLSLSTSLLSLSFLSPVWFYKWDSLASHAIVVGSECPHSVLFLNHNPPKRPMSKDTNIN